MTPHFQIGTTPSGEPVDLPLDIATESTAIIARKGRGKSYTARVLAEALIAQHIQVVVADPTDVWWGIRAAKDGKGSGCDVVVFGGLHADLPLTESSGKTLADAVVDHGLSAILVTSHLSKAASRRFLADFGERLYERKHEEQHKTALTFIVDEADIFAPQQMTPEATRCAGVLDELARRGRVRGLGIVAITQRPAVMNKNILSQTETLICLQVVGPQDRKALSEWTDANADLEQSKEFLRTLATFQQGEAWVWSPSADLFERIHVGEIATFDSMRTPKAGEKRVAAPRLRPVDLDGLRTKLAATIEQAEANNPTKLRAEIAKLKRELAAKPAAKVDVSVVDAAVRQAEKRWLAVQNHAKGKLLHEVLAAVTAAFEKDAKDSFVSGVLRDMEDPATRHALFANSPLLAKAVEVPKRAPPQTSVNVLDTKPFSKAERSILSVLMQYREGRTRVQVALLAGYAHTGGGYLNAVGSLRTRGCITVNGDDLFLTPYGVETVGTVEPLPTGEALIKYWYDRLDKAPRLALHAVVEAYPNVISKVDIAQKAGYEAAGGGFLNALGKLRTLELIERENGDYRASSTLMEEKW